MLPLPQSDLDFICRQSEPLWAETRGQRLFLTGGTGFFGCWLVESFLEANRRFGLRAELTVLTRSPESFLERCPHLANREALRLVRGSLADFSFKEVCEAGRASSGQDVPFVIHAATETDERQWRANPTLLHEQAVSGSRRVMDFALAHGTRKFLFTSSGAVYGTQPPEVERLSEDYAGGIEKLRTSIPYGEAKLATEKELLAHGGRMEVRIARCFAFAGPHLPLNEHFAIGNFLADALAGHPMEIKGDGRPVRSYLYAADLALWLWTILFRGAPGGIYNTGSERAVTVLELAKAVARTVEPPLPVQVALPAAEGLAPRYLPSTAKAQNELGLREHFALDDAIRRTFDWHRSQNHG
jgi:dTDP-glucose 4,6-dehydratase